VIPAYEIINSTIAVEEFPKNKAQLLLLLDQQKIQQVHKSKWEPAHGATNYTRWNTADQIYEIEYASEYEPFILLEVSNTPRYCNNLKKSNLTN
jgi:hypothetical protein